MVGRKLKVFQAQFGFYDTVVAAPSQAAALRAWGTHQDLFASGAATVTTDEAAIAAALAHPETPSAGRSARRTPSSSRPPVCRRFRTRRSVQTPNQPPGPGPRRRGSRQRTGLSSTRRRLGCTSWTTRANERRRTSAAVRTSWTTRKPPLKALMSRGARLRRPPSSKRGRLTAVKAARTEFSLPCGPSAWPRPAWRLSAWLSGPSWPAPCLWR